MSLPKKSFRKWKLNYVIQYIDESSANRYRPLVLGVLESVAALRRIDYAIEEEYPFQSVSSEYQDIQPLDTCSDLVHFRSSKDSLTSIKEFRKLMELLFDGHSVYGLYEKGMPFSAYPQTLDGLSKFPFPEDDFYHPLEYPCLECHNNGVVKIGVPVSVVESLQNDVKNKSLN